jgi:pimeloyl-ACP methyl ester carboxylesterase
MTTAYDTTPSRVRITEATLQLDGLETFVRECGQAAAEAVVFVHGNPTSGADWSDLLVATGEFAYAVALDMPNYGRSQRSRRFACTVSGYANHLDALIRELGIRRVHLVLHDFGGPWGLHWAADHLDAVASITLFNVGVMPDYRWHKYARIWRTPIVGELFMAGVTRFALRTLLNRENPRPLPDAFVDRIFAEVDGPSKRAQLALYRATPDVGALSEQLGERLAPRRFPALVVWGAGDSYVPVRHAAVQARYFAADIHVLPDCGHWPFIDDPERCRTLLTQFLRLQLSPLAVKPSGS